MRNIIPWKYKVIDSILQVVEFQSRYPSSGENRPIDVRVAKYLVQFASERIDAKAEPPVVILLQDGGIGLRWELVDTTVSVWSSKVGRVEATIANKDFVVSKGDINEVLLRANKIITALEKELQVV